MKKSQKILSIILTVLTLVSVFSCAMPVWAAEVTAYTEQVENSTEITTDEANTENETANETQPEPQIIGEDESRRDESTKHYIMSNGTRRAVKYSQPIHYEKDGEWVDIDNTLEYDSQSQKYKNKSNSFDVEFDKDLNSDRLFSIENKGYTMAWEYKGNALRSAFVDGEVEEADTDKMQDYQKYTHKHKSKIKYRNFESDCTLEYVVTGTGVKENIIVNSADCKNEFTFDVTAEGLELIKNEDGSITAFAEGTVEEIFYIPAPFMYDSNNEYCYDVSYSIEAKNGRYKITLVADKQWLSAQEREFPVTIDPVIETRKEKSAITATFIASGKPNTNFDEMKDAYIGVESSEYQKCRSLFKFSLPTLNKGDMVTNACLGIYLYDSSFYTDDMPDKQINAHVISGSWNASTVTWSSGIGFSNVALDYDFIKRSESNSYVWLKRFDITKAVKSWYEGTSTNYGILIKSEVEDGSYVDVAARACFWTEDYNSEEDLYPYISIEYRNNKGLEDYWSYSAYGIDTAGTAYVNDYTGNLVYSMPILSSISEKMPLTLSAVFNNYCAGEKLPVGKNKSSRTTPGKGFRLNIQETVLTSDLYGLTGDALEKYPYVYTDGDGTEHYIQKVVENEGEANETTTYKDEDGLGLTLKVGEECKYKIVDKFDNIRYFNAKGNLFKMTDANGNEIHIYFKDADTANGLEDRSRISYITDGAGHKYTFTYYVTNGVENDYIKRITDNAGRFIDFNTSAGLLRKVTYSDGTVTSLFYNLEGTEDLIDYAVANDGYGLNFNYTSEATGRRIRAVIEYCATDKNLTTFVKGQRVTFDRTKYNTTVIRTAGIDGCHYANSYNAENDTDTDTNNDGVVDGADDIITTLQFDNAGRTVSQQLKYGGGSFVGAGAYSYTSTTEDATTLGNKNRVASTGSLGKNVVNLLAGGNAESLSGWTAVNSDSVTAATGATAGEQYMGAKSLKLQNTAMTAAGVSYYRQVVTGISDKSNYTLSAYVKTSGLAEKFAGTRNGAYVQISAYDADGNALKTVYSESLCADTDTGIDNGWRRLTVTLPATANAVSVKAYLCLRNMTGNAYFDCIQLEAGATANTYNMLENGSFEKSSGGLPTSWTPINTSYSVDSAGAVLNGSTTSAKANGTKSIRITGETDISKGYKQTVYVQGNPNDTYIVSGWARGYPVNSTYHNKQTEGASTDTTEDDKYEDTALFEIGILVVYDCTDKDGNVTEVSEYKDSAKFNTTITDWQYSSAPFVLKYRNPESGCTYTPKYVVIVPRYCKQENHIYFDHLMLSKEPAQTYSYDKEGNLISLSANTEQKANMDYDDETNDLTSYTDAVGRKTTMKYDNHNLTHSTSAKGVTSAHGYNTDGTPRVDELRNTLAHADATMAIRTEYEYHTGGEDTHGIKDGAYLKYFYDENGYATQYTCNWATGAPKTVTDANGTTTSTSYYGNYEKPQTVTTGSSKVTYTYDGTRTGTNGGNRIKSILFGTSSVGETYSFGYDNYGNRTKTLVGSTVLSENHYKAKNGLLYLTEYGNGDTIEYTYTKLGAPYTRVKTGDSTTTYKWSYDASGTVLAHTDSSTGYKYTYSYDSLGRLVRQNVLSYAGDDDGVPVSFTENVYDKRDNLTKVINNIGGRTVKQHYSYAEVSENSASAEYKKDNLATRYRISETRYAIYDYDAINRLTQRTFTTERKLYNNYVYKTSNRNAEGSTRYCTTQLGTEFIDNDSYTYTYDAVGNITSIKKGTRTSTNPKEAGFKTVSGATAYRSYEYDALGQLKRENNNSKNATAEWNYDILGNIESTITYDYTTGEVGDRRTAIDYQYTNDGKAGWNKLLTTLVHKEYGYNTAGRYISKQTVEDIDYDEIGNPVSYNYTDYVYNAETKQLEETGTRTGPTLKWTGRELYRYQSDSFQNNYYYDADGLRSRKNIYTKNDSGSFEYAGKTMYQYLGSQLAYQCTYNATGAVDTEIYYFYDSYGKLTAMRYIKGSTDHYYYVTTNAQDDVLGIYSASGVLKASYEYDAWGNATVYKVTQDEQGNNIYTDITDTPNSTHIAAQNPIRYRGYYYDSETGLYYVSSRYYDPEIGRWINADSVIAGVGGELKGYNLFAYCFNNPVNMDDQDGNWPKWIKNTVKWVAKNIVKPVVKTVQKTLSKVDLTYSTGVNVSGTPSAWIFNGQIGVSMDTKGNVAIQASGGGGITGGDPGISITRYQSVTNAPNIDKLNDAYYQVGGSIAVPIEGVPVAAGGDVMFMPDPALNTGYFGLTGNVGFGTPGKEFHFEWGTTVTLPYTQFNVYEVARSVYIKIMEW